MRKRQLGHIVVQGSREQRQGPEALNNHRRVTLQLSIMRARSCGIGHPGLLKVTHLRRTMSLHSESSQSYAAQATPRLNELPRCLHML
jgi:hypothetical protein